MAEAKNPRLSSREQFSRHVNSAIHKLEIAYKNNVISKARLREGTAVLRGISYGSLPSGVPVNQDLRYQTIDEYTKKYKKPSVKISVKEFMQREGRGATRGGGGGYPINPKLGGRDIGGRKPPWRKRRILE